MFRSILSEAAYFEKCQSCADIRVHWWQVTSSLSLLRDDAISACWREPEVGQWCPVRVMW